MAATSGLWHSKCFFRVLEWVPCLTYRSVPTALLKVKMLFLCVLNSGLCLPTRKYEGSSGANGVTARQSTINCGEKMLHAAAVFSESHLVLEPLSNQQLHLKLLQLMGKATVSGVVKTWLPGIKRESLHLPRWSDFGTSESMASARTSARADDRDHHIPPDTVLRLQYL